MPPTEPASEPASEPPIGPTPHGVHSEVGRLRTVLVCEPGLAHRRLTPSTSADLLFDDVLWVDAAIEDHRAFQAELRGRGVEVVELHALLTETLEVPGAREWLLDRAVTPNTAGLTLLEPARVFLDALPARRLAEGGGGDVIADLAVPFPVAVISELLGVPSDGNEHLRPLVHDSTAFIDAAADDLALQRAETAVIAIAEFFEELIAQKRRRPDDGLLSALMTVETEGDRLSHEELIANTMLLYAAGFETTSNLIGNGLWMLLSNPDQMERLRAQAELIPSSVWEMLRWDSPVQLNVRTVLEEVELFGRVHRRGTQFLVLQGSANRDGTVFADAGRVDVSRFSSPDTPPPLSFGWGAHHCLGAHLARAEGEIVFAALLQRFAEISLDGTALAAQSPHYRRSFTLRGLDSLPVRVA